MNEGQCIAVAIIVAMFTLSVLGKLLNIIIGCWFGPGGCDPAIDAEDQQDTADRDLTTG